MYKLSPEEQDLVWEAAISTAMYDQHTCVALMEGHFDHLVKKYAAFYGSTNWVTRWADFSDLSDDERRTTRVLMLLTFLELNA